MGLNSFTKFNEIVIIAAAAGLIGSAAYLVGYTLVNVSFGQISFS